MTAEKLVQAADIHSKICELKHAAYTMSLGEDHNQNRVPSCLLDKKIRPLIEALIGSELSKLEQQFEEL